MESRNWNQNNHISKNDGYVKCKACTKNSDEFRSYEGIITAVITLFSVFSGLLIQLLIYNIFSVRIQEVPTILLVVLWIGFSSVVTYIISCLDL